MRYLPYLVVGVVLLIAVSALGTVLSMREFTPSVILPIVIFLGVVPQEESLSGGVVVSFILGYLVDLFSGQTMGLHTFAMVATFLMSRAASFRFLLRGVVSQVGLVFAIALLHGGAILALVAIFVKASWEVPSVMRVAFGSAISTAVVAPFIFALLRRLTRAEAANMAEKTG